MKKMCAILLMMSMIISVLPGNLAFAAESKVVSRFEGTGYEVCFTVDSQWSGGFQATVQIQNTGTAKIENWCLGFEMPGSIQNIWNAKIDSQEENRYAIKNVGWNQDIETGETVSFGFIAGSGFEDCPQEYYMQSERILADTDRYTMKYT
ncbi:MAG: cellulose binding domain-containing protein, partial [Eubacteriales bacterium]|nr:cellulose binding domain-containing protein [Eubacteriales bacterium]